LASAAVYDTSLAWPPHVIVKGFRSGEFGGHWSFSIISGQIWHAATPA